MAKPRPGSKAAARYRKPKPPVESILAKAVEPRVKPPTPRELEKAAEAAAKATASAPGTAKPLDESHKVPLDKDGAPDWMKEAAARIEQARVDVILAQDKAKATEGKRKPGRPPAYLIDYCELAVEMGRAGMEIVEIAGEFDVSTKTLYQWEQDHDEFGEALARAREAAEIFHTRRLREELDRPVSSTNTANRLSMMARRFKGWREKNEILHDTGDGLAQLMGLIDGKSRGLGKA